jgi:hypothetical protein
MNDFFVSILEPHIKNYVIQNIFDEAFIYLVYLI